MVEVAPGIVLIADPFLKDPNFMRTTVFICEHEESGTLGFVMNRKHNAILSDLLPDLEQANFPVYYGGPVQPDTLQFLHTKPALLGGIELVDGIFWGGEFEELMAVVQKNQIHPNHIRFFIGYSGWSEAQLAGELEQKSWLTTTGNKKLVFQQDEKQIWPEAIKQLGGEYEQIIHYPIDPTLN